MAGCPVCGRRPEQVPDNAALKVLEIWGVAPILLNLVRPYLDKLPYCHECKLIYLRLE